MIKLASRRGFFQYSPREYTTNMRNSMLNSSIKRKKLTYKGIDDAEINVNLYGYPIQGTNRNLTEEQHNETCDALENSLLSSANIVMV